MRRALVTGGSGFIGSNLTDRLLSQGVEVVVYDNFSTGFREFVAELRNQPGATVVEGDLLDRKRLQQTIEGCDVVFHMAANADVRHGLEHPERDLEQNAIATSHLLEAMRAAGVNRIAFCSTASVYGEPEVFPTLEDCPFPIQTSLYAASKLAAEGIIEAYCHGFGFSALIFRLVSILGERYTHGHVFDFYRSLKQDPTQLTVLGDGRQEKSYLYVQDCVDAMLIAHDAQGHSAGETTIYNLGSEETLVVTDSVATISEYMNASPKCSYTGGERGWPGDSPLIRLDCSRIRALGWRPKVSIREATHRTLNWFDGNPWVFERRRNQ